MPLNYLESRLVFRVAFFQDELKLARLYSCHLHLSPR